MNRYEHGCGNMVTKRWEDRDEHGRGNMVTKRWEDRYESFFSKQRTAAILVVGQIVFQNISAQVVIRATCLALSPQCPCPWVPLPLASPPERRLEVDLDLVDDALFLGE